MLSSSTPRAADIAVGQPYPFSAVCFQAFRLRWGSVSFLRIGGNEPRDELSSMEDLRSSAPLDSRGRLSPHFLNRMPAVAYPTVRAGILLATAVTRGTAPFVRSFDPFVAAASALSSAVAFSGVLNVLGAVRGAPNWLFFTATMLVLVAAGAVLEGLPALLLLVPILMPMAVRFGINPLQYGIAAIIAMGIGAHLPPVGIGLYTACVVTDTPVEAVGRALLPYLVVLCLGLLAVLFVPQLSLYLPSVLGPRSR